MQNIIIKISAIALLSGCGLTTQSKTHQSFDRERFAPTNSTAGEVQAPTFMGSVHVNAGSSAEHACGAIVLDAQVVLTTARCVLDFVELAPVHPSRISFSSLNGKNAASNTQQSIGVAEVTIHPYALYGILFDVPHSDDLALLRLTKPIANATAANLATQSPADLAINNVALVGWSTGQDFAAQEPGRQIQAVELENTMLAMQPTAKSKSAPRDGDALLQLVSGKWQVVGLHHGFGTSDQNKINRHYYTAVHPYAEWIERETKVLGSRAIGTPVVSMVSTGGQ